VVVIDEPLALADTVTPPIFSPAAFLIEPASTTSAALAEKVSARLAAAEAARIARCRLCCMVSFSLKNIRAGIASAGRRCGGGRRHRQCLHEGGDGFD